MQSAFIIHRVVHLKRCKRGVNPFEKSSEFPIFRAFRSTEIFCPNRQTGYHAASSYQKLSAYLNILPIHTVHIHVLYSALSEIQVSVLS